jgi:hypothetical protein
MGSIANENMTFDFDGSIAEIAASSKREQSLVNRRNCVWILVIDKTARASS